jgi:hypothetical protein
VDRAADLRGGGRGIVISTGNGEVGDGAAFATLAAESDA